MEHFPQPFTQHLQLACDAIGLLTADALGMPCQTRTNPSIKTSAAFANRDVMALVWSVRFAVPYEVCLITASVEIIIHRRSRRVSPRQEAIKIQFFNSPQVSMDLP